MAVAALSGLVLSGSLLSGLLTVTPTQASGSCPGGRTVLTLADSGRTILSTMDHCYVLDLAPDYTWTVTDSNPAVLPKVGNTDDGVYKTAACPLACFSSATVTAVGVPIFPLPSSLEYRRLFQVTITTIS
jgi:hypothetical protein